MTTYEIVIKGRRFNNVVALHMDPERSYLTYFDEEQDKVMTYSFDICDIDNITIAAVQETNTE